MFDIEDIGDSGDVRDDSTFKKGKVTNRKFQRKSTNQKLVNNESLETESVFNRGQTIYMRTWGCTHNTSDSEYMAGQLAEAGFKVKFDDKERLKANLWVLNSCTVKNPAEDHFKNAIQAAQSANIPVVVTGCVPQGSPKDKFVKGLSTVGVQQIDRVVEVVEETLKGNTVKIMGPKKAGGKRIGGADLSLPKIRRNPYIEVISINTGCLNNCTYCKTKYARGDLASYPIEDIKQRLIQAFEEGVIEIWLTSEDTGAYGIDLGTDLPALLAEIVPTIPEGCMMRIGMTNPPYILNHLHEIAKYLNHPRVYSFLHVPVQSGSDQVLYTMKREYTNADFCKVVDILREEVPGVNIATDIIAGFPTETEADFQDTMALCDKYKFKSLFMNQFFPRPGTPAAKWEQIPRQDIKKRTKKLSELFNSYVPFGGEVDKEYSVLITEMAHDGVSLVGHNKCYDQIIIKGNVDKLMGRRVTVRITGVTKHSMFGEVISEPIDPSIAVNHQLIAKKRNETEKTEIEKNEPLDLIKKILIPIGLTAGVFLIVSRIGRSR